MRGLAACAALLVGASIAVGARAQDATEEAVTDDERVAREHFARGREHFDAARWDAAAREFLTAYDLAPLAPLLINAARAYEHLDRYREAEALLERVLTFHPEWEGRASVEALRDRMRAQADAAEESRAEAPDDGASLLVPALVAGGVAVVALAVAGGLWIDAKNDERELATLCGTRPCTDADVDATGGPTQVVITNVLLGVGAVAGAAAGVLLTLELTREAEPEGADVSVTLGPLGAHVRGVF